MGACESDKRAADLRASGVAIGVKDARVRMSRFAGAEQLTAFAVEGCAPLDELGDALGAFFDEHFCGGAVNEAIACGNGVFKMQCDVFPALGGDGDATLSVVGIRFAERLLGDDENLAVIGERDGCAETGYSCSDDEIIDHFRRRHNL